MRLYLAKVRNLYLSQGRVWWLMSGESFTYEAPMDLTAVPFGTTDWLTLEPVVHPGITGSALWRTCHFGTTRVRMVEYTPGYLADHWCWRGHVLLCLEGELHTELEDGRQFTLTAGMSYQVGDDMEGHRSSTRGGAKLFIVD